MVSILNLPERLQNKLAQDPETGCWVWVAKWNSGNGYGKVSWKNKPWMAHRLVWTLLVGPICPGLVLDHVKELCSRRDCCNPTHLSPVTPALNTYRGRAALYKPRMLHK